MARQFSQADRRELVRLIEEDGRSLREAAALLGCSESTARRWRAAARSAVPHPPTAERRVAPATPERVDTLRPALPAALPAPVVIHRPDRAVRQRPPAKKVIGARLRRVPARVRAYRWSRRQVGGLALTVAFIPVGWILSALIFDRTGDGDARATLISSTARGTAPPGNVEFDPDAVRAPREKGTNFVALARGRKLAIYRKPGGKRLGTLRERRFEGKRLQIVTLVQRRKGDWARVYLPERPNLSLAWVKLDDVKVRANPYRIRIELKRHRLSVWRGPKLLARKKIGVGESLSPTPLGRYFVTDLVKNRTPKDLYGPYAFGLSAHSPVITSFRGGNGQIGIHGTNDPATLGTNVSKGCIRVGNDTITALAKVLPLGTPVVIRR